MGLLDTGQQVSGLEPLYDDSVWCFFFNKQNIHEEIQNVKKKKKRDT